MTDWLLKEPGTADGGRAVRLAGAGRCLPPTRLTTSELMATTRHRNDIDLERLTGIHERRVSDGDHDSFSLAVGAAQDLLGRWDGDPAGIDLVISCSITRYRDGLQQWLEPSAAADVARAVGAPDAVAFDVSNACAGMLTGLFVAQNWIRRGAAERALVVSGEYISQLGRNAAAHVRTIASREMASLTLGDAGAALLLEPAGDDQPGITFSGFTTIADHSRLCVAYPAGHDPGARMYTKARTLHNVAIADITVVMQEVLEVTGLDISDVDWIIPHQTSARAIRKGMARTAEELGGEPREPAVVTVDRYGNTASTTHTVAIVEGLEAGDLRPGDRVALLALASGIELGVVVFTVDDALVAPFEEARRGHDG